MRLAILVYGVICYLVTLATCIYLVGFVGNLIVPITIDGQPASHFLWAVAIDTSLVVLFGVQHSLMARPIIKRRLSRFIPESAERSTYVLMTSLFLILLFWCWQPIGIDLWRFENQYLRAAVYVLFFAGWGLVFLSTTLIDHFEMFGLRQAWCFFRQKPYSPTRFKTPWFYNFVRHPVYFGLLLAFWATTSMTVSHLLFASTMSIYIMVGIYFEERDLIEKHGSTYVRYRNEVPMIIPGFPSKLLDESGQHHGI